MKQIYTLVSILLLTTACGSDNSEPNGSIQDINLSAEELKKMKPNDFDATITLEIMSGTLDGTYVFKKIQPDESNRLIQIGMKKGPGYKDEVTKPGSLMAGTTRAENSDLFLINMQKEFIGMIKEGTYPSADKDKTITLQNKAENPMWDRAYAKVLTKNDVTFTDVDDWQTIRRNNEVRRVQGYFTEQVELSYSSGDKKIPNETVDIKVSFDMYEIYRPNSSNRE